LANTIEIERLSSSPSSATFVGNGRRTLEDMVIELMRPLLKDWLEKNLPTVVERLVQKEIDHIVKRS
jgi:cell pole-organizing protein PopZ